MIPFPFTRVVFSYGDPITIPRDATDAQMEGELSVLVQNAMEKTNRIAEEALEDESHWKA